MAKSDRKTRIAEDWQPDDAGREFAASNGVPDTEIGAFVDYHLAKGDTMASWPAAWRTWCRNAVKYGSASGRRGNPIVSLVPGLAPADDPWGMNAWIATLRDMTVGTWEGQQQPCLNGYALRPSVVDICEAAAVPRDLRLNLEPIAAWLRDDIDPDKAAAAIRSAQRRPDRPNLRWYDGLVRQLADRKRA